MALLCARFSIPRSRRVSARARETLYTRNNNSRAPRASIQAERCERITCLKINSVIARHGMLRIARIATGDIVLITVKGLINFLPEI